MRSLIVLASLMLLIFVWLSSAGSTGMDSYRPTPTLLVPE